MTATSLPYRWRRSIPVVISLAALLLAPGAEARDTTSGTIVLIHYNSELIGRGLCIQMSPTPIPGDWACLAISNPLYKEITALLQSAVYTHDRCDVVTDPVPPTSSLRNEIKLVTCYGTPSVN